MYTSPLAMMQQFGVQRLTKYASPIDAVVIKVVPAAVLRAVIVGGDTSSFSDDQVELANNALVRIQDNIQAAESVVNAYLIRRYQVPLSTTLLEANQKLLSRHTNSIARYLLAAHKPSVTIRSAYDASIGWLDDITSSNRGGLSLGEEETDIATSHPTLTPPFSVKQSASRISWQCYRRI